MDTLRATWLLKWEVKALKNADVCEFYISKGISEGSCSLLRLIYKSTQLCSWLNVKTCSVWKLNVFSIQRGWCKPPSFRLLFFEQRSYLPFMLHSTQYGDICRNQKDAGHQNQTHLKNLFPFFCHSLQNWENLEDRARVCSVVMWYKNCHVGPKLTWPGVLSPKMANSLDLRRV